MPIILTRKNLRDLLTMKEVIQALEEGFLSYARGKTVVPVRLPVEVKPRKGICLLMPAVQEGPDGLGVKVVSVYPENPKRGLPTISSSYILCDPRTGALLSLMEGAMLTGLRTGAASGLASRFLARKDSKTLGIFGAGVQSGFQLEAMRVVLPSLKKVYVFDMDRERTKKFIINLANSSGIELKEAKDSAEVVKESDVIITTTTSSTPVFDGKLLKPGTHINAVGAFTPTTREVDEETIRQSKIIVDTYEGCLSEAGDILIPMGKGLFSKEQIYSDLGGLVSGKKTGRENSQEITLFESVGTAIEDLVVARLAYEKAREKGVGLPFEL
jgi:alanine dehydrogenase